MERGKIMDRKGFNAKSHIVYFGDNFEDVNNATGGTTQIDTTYPLDPLNFGKTHYWRVDEFDGAATHKGEIWSFTTISDIVKSD